MVRGTSSTDRVGDCSGEGGVAGKIPGSAGSRAAYLAAYPGRTHTFVIRSRTRFHWPHKLSLHIVTILAFVSLLCTQELLHSPNLIVFNLILFRVFSPYT